ncbi:hypothetical protein [Bacillus sp. 165]|uniref:hypothetical protein n=1 Tax=Bacillus sp. 165 TaxID=1529117 RepID=UPI001ADA84FC|nr:hypothetical protein [Bacillus sp. 165]MBO9129157.1 hypothetical protein [Bacillus sp. 165]
MKILEENQLKTQAENEWGIHMESMETARAKHIIRLLLGGLDPHTGKVFSPPEPYKHPDTVRALMRAEEGLDRLIRSEKRAIVRPNNSGKEWTKEEDEEIITKYKSGKTIEEIARLHERSVRAIEIRLNRYGTYVFE